MRETAAPMPRVPPVTIATRSAMNSSLTLPQAHSSEFCRRRNCRALPDNDAPAPGHRTAPMTPFPSLCGAAAGTHAADQLALAPLPLPAPLVLGAGPDI